MYVVMLSRPRSLSVVRKKREIRNLCIPVKVKSVKDSSLSLYQFLSLSPTLSLSPLFLFFVKRRV
jgi:hypothetical protein